MKNNIKSAQRYNSNYLVILSFCSILLLRIIPHIANCVPIFAILTFFSLNYKISKKAIILITLIAILISDLLLSVIHGYPIFGIYSLFTYSGFALVIILCTKAFSRNVLLINTIVATVVYWLWTNFGVWLADGIYNLDSTGLFFCYTVALPFLKYSMLANVIGVILFMGAALRGAERGIRLLPRSV